MHTADRPRVSTHERIARIASLAPVAGWVRVRAGDAGLPDGEVEALATALTEIDDPVVRDLVGLTDLAVAERVAMLAQDPSLEARSLAAAGMVIADASNGAAGRLALLGLWRAASGAPAPATLSRLERALEGGAEVALSGPDPFDGADPRRTELLELAALAPFAAFVMVAEADGAIEDREVAAFTAGLAEAGDPLLAEIVEAIPTPAAARIATLTADEGEARNQALFAAGLLFHEEPGGPAAQAALLGVLERVAAAHGRIRPTEGRVIDRVREALDHPGEVIAEADRRSLPPQPLPTAEIATPAPGAGPWLWVGGGLLLVALAIGAIAALM